MPSSERPTHERIPMGARAKSVPPVSASESQSLLAAHRWLLTLLIVAALAATFVLVRGRATSINSRRPESTKVVVPRSARTASSLAPVATSYTWTPLLGSTDWQVPANWTPTRFPTDPSDVLIFNGSTVTVTNVPDEVIAELDLVNASVTLEAETTLPGDKTLTISGGAGSDRLTVPSGSSLTLAGTTNLTISLGSGSTGRIDGNVALLKAAHKLTANVADAIKFKSGSIFAAGSTTVGSTGFTGNPFGTGTDGSVVFQGGSASFFSEGSDPFGGTGKSVATFSLGSSQTLFVSSAFSYDGRTYGNLTLNGSQSYTGSGTGLLTIFNTLTIVSGSTLTLSNSSGGNLNLLGDITINGTLDTNGRTVLFQGGGIFGGDTQNITNGGTFGDVIISKGIGSVKLGNTTTISGALQFDGSSSAVDVLELNGKTLNLDGTVGGTSSSAANGFKGDANATLNIGGSGSLSASLKFTSGNEKVNTLKLDRSSGSVVLASNLTIGNVTTGSLTLTNGTLNAGANTISLLGPTTASRTNGYVIGNLEKTFGATGSFTFPVGTANGYSPVDTNVTAGTGNSLTVKAVEGAHPNLTAVTAKLQRYWTLSNSGPVTAHLTFHYLDADVVGTESLYKVLKYNSGFTTPTPQSVDISGNTGTVTGVSSFSDWTLAGADYSVTTSGNAIVVTDAAGNSDTLEITEPNPGEIKFAATGRVFNIDGTTFVSGDSGNLSLSGITSITVNQGNGDDIANVGAFTSSLPSLTINGDAGNDTVNFNGDIPFAADANLDVDLQNDTTPGTDVVNFAASANVALSGTGTATVKVSKNIAFGSGSSITVVNGALTIEGNQQTTPTSGNFIGIDVNNGLIQATGTGVVTVQGKGGNDVGGNQLGIQVQGGGDIIGGTSGLLTVEGIGGAASGNSNHGIYVTGAGSTINSGGGNVSVTGTGGGVGTSRNNVGVNLDTAGQITASGSGTVTVVGQGGNLTGTGRINFGVYLADSGTTIASSGGNVSVTGTGGGGGSGNENFGVLVDPGGQITAGGSGTVTVTGFGGNLTGTGERNIGVYVHGASSAITSNGGNVSVTGTGGGAGSSGTNYGVLVDVAGQITAGGSGTVTVAGNGGTGSGGSNHGVFVTDASSTITSGGGSVSVTGTEGGSASVAINVTTSGSVTTATNGGTLTLIGNSMNFDATSIISAQSGSSVTLRQRTNGVAINLGAATDPTGGPLSLTDTELDQVTAGTINIGDANSGAITVSAAITRAASTILNLTSGGAINLNASLDSGGGNVKLTPGASAAVDPAATGTDVSMSTTGTLSFASGADLSIAITGATVDTQYRQLNVIGKVDLTGVDLKLSGSHTPSAGETFTIVENDGADLITGEFNSLPEGTIIPNFLGSAFGAKITYIGGDGNDVVLTVVAADVSVAVSPASVLENGATNLDYTFTRSGNTSGDLTVSFTVGGTATFGTDYGQSGAATYTATTGTVTFTGTNTTAVVTIDPTADSNYETDETVILTVTSGSGYTVAASPNDTATGTITNDDSPPATLVVTKTADTDDTCVAGNCSLREAIKAANLNPDANTINFNIPNSDPGRYYYATNGGAGVATGNITAANTASDDSSIADIDPQYPHSWWSIGPTALLGPLPAITSPVTINGYTQRPCSTPNPSPCSQANTLANGNDAQLSIELNGASIVAADTDGLFVTAGSSGTVGGSAISGLVINHFTGNGIKLTTTGGTFSSGNQVTGNFIGTDVSGTLAAANNVGVYVDNTAGNLIGGTTPGKRNVISGNSDEGVEIYGASPTFNAKNNLVQGNFIGTNKTGLLDLGNGGAGVKIYDGSNNTIGVDSTSMLASGGNVISGNGSHGVEIASLVMVVASTTTDNVVQGNFIGTDLDGTLNLYNDGSGVAIYDASSNVIGGVTSPLGNVIANNVRTGVLVEETIAGGPNPAIKNSIRGNSIHDNGALGIDLTPAPLPPASPSPTPTPAPSPGDGVTLNDDPGDADTGPNNLQNFPGIAPPNAGSTAVTGTLHSSSGGTFTIDIYSNDACDSSGHGEGKEHLGSGPAVVTSNPEEYTFNIPVAALSSTQVLTATATDQNGNTSEFSNCVAVVGLGTSISGSKSLSGSTFPNSTISYTIILSNSAGVDQSDNPGDEFKDVLPVGLTLISADASAGVATATPATRTVAWNGSILAGDSVTITITATINSGTEGQTITNQGTINSDADNNGFNETQTTTNSVAFVVCPATLVVTTSANSGAGSLRQAILDACPGATITFDMTPGHVTSPITLTGGELAIAKDVRIQGPTATALTISGNGSNRVFNVQSGTSLVISNLTIANGKVTGSGGAIYSLGNLTIVNSTFTDNQAVGGEGGAIDSEGGNLTIINSTISGNKADLDGGGILNCGSSTGLLTNVTITNNRADADGDTNGEGGGLGQVSSSNLTLNNTIVAGNFRGTSPGTKDDVFVNVAFGSFIDGSSSNNLIGVDTGLSDISNGNSGNRVGTAAVPIDPRLGALANNGGPTKTHFLLSDSPALNAGSNGLALGELGSPLVTDQRGAGFPRIINGTVDIGAFEANYTITATAGTPQSTLVNTAFATQLQATVTESGNIQSGVTVTFTAPASGASGTFPGSVTTANATTNASGVATAPVFTANGTAGSYNVTASLFSGLPSTTFALTNTKATTTTTVISSVNPSNSGQNVTFTASVTSSAGSPTGTVTFKDNGVAISGCEAKALTSGQATCDTAALAPGNHPITADYNGDANFAISTGTLSGGQVVKSDVSVTVSPSAVAEDGVPNLVYTFTRNGSTANALTINFSVGGTATLTTDYSQTGAASFSTTAGTVTFGAGNSTTTITVDPTADTTFEGNETVILTVTAGTGYNVGSPSAATGTITNDDTSVSVAVAPSSVEEDGELNLVYTFTRNGATASALTINFSVGGTATFTTDYTQTGAASFNTTAGTVTFDAGNSTATVTINPSTDTELESDETVILTVTSGTGYNVASPSAATGTITNDDTALQLLLDPAGPASNQAVAVDSILFMRDPFPIDRLEKWFNFPGDDNTRVMLFAYFQLLPGETANDVVVEVIDSASHIYNVTAEDVRSVNCPPCSQPMSQVMFRLPDMPAGTVTVRVKVHTLTSNAGTFRVTN